MASLLLRLVSALLSVLCMHAGLAVAQDYPSQPIRLVIPWGSGGATDITFRLWTPLLAESLGQQVVIDNRGGASSIIGLDNVAKSPPNGYTLGVTNIAFGANPSLVAKMPFDSQKDFLPVTLTTLVPLVLTVHPSVPVKTVKELIVLGRAKPDSLKYASAGNASGSHLSTELFLDVAGIKVLHVPYKSGGQQVIAVVGGETSLAFVPVSNSLPHIKSGKLVALGISSLKRDRALPAVPTIAEEIGISDFEVADWHGVVVPAGTSQAVIRRLHQAITKVLSRADVVERIEGIGTQTIGSTPDEMAAYVKREFERWSKLIKAKGIHADI